MKGGSYERLDLKGGTAMVSPRSKGALGRVDAVVFDCDGTLIDVRGSYDTTIMRTVALMTERFSGAVLDLEGSGVGGRLILKIRSTGGFNSDWDTTYALSLFTEAAIERCGPRAGAESLLRRLEEVVEDFGSRKRLAGHESVDRYVLRSGLRSARLEELRRSLGYPGNAMTSAMAAAFDQVYYGARLFRRVYGVAPAVSYPEGLIDRETLLVGRDDLVRFRRLAGGGGRMAMATGRPFVAVKHTLGPLLRFFERAASVYIGDGDIYPALEPELAVFRKPSGASLVRAHQRLGAKVMLYIGDSAEDRLMVDDARRSYPNTLFAGICGSSFDEAEQERYFTRTSSDVLVRSVDQVPEVLEIIRGERWR
ncbi:MAG: HAD family hydrolase [Nitrososphaerales archaeon]|jgi:phosphoglycolate phosphatase-like HAD superfamily hydrolase